ncbi:hypothetical protein HON01_04100, partial [Candidatus Woesearchaeota archaeon]|nr:hypothetical protein [Candidatus Woesearchaeota archaeon]
MNKLNNKLKLAVGASGSGTCLQSVIDNSFKPDFDFEVVCVFSDEPECFALGRAKNHNIPTLSVPVQKITSSNLESTKRKERKLLERILQEERLLKGYNNQKGLLEYNPDYVVLLGYERIITGHFLSKFPNRVLNTHPAPLEFQGIGGYDWALGYHKDAVRRNDWTCVTFHFVNDKVDHGPVICQTPMKITLDDDSDSLSDRGKNLEYDQISTCLQWFAEGKVIFNNDSEVEINLEKMQRNKIDYMLNVFEGEDKSKKYEFILSFDEFYDEIKIKKEGNIINPNLCGYYIPKNTPNSLEFTYLYRGISKLRNRGFDINFNFHGLNIHPVYMKKNF